MDERISRGVARRRLLRAVAAAAAGGLPAGVRAQAGYPARPVKFIVNFPPGGPMDVIARGLAERLTASLGQPFVVENRAGAGGNLGAEAVARSAPDGYTVLLSIDTPFTVNATLYPSMPFRPGDLVPLMLFATSGLTVGVSPSLGVGTLAELVARGRAQPLAFSSAGNGSPGHLATAILNDRAGMRIDHVPYRGNAPAVMAVASGEVQGGVLATPGFAPQVAAGRVRPLAVTGRARSPLLPGVPTVAEAGLPALEIEVLYLAMLPAGTPAAVAARLRDALQQALSAPDLRDRLRAVDLSVTPADGAALGERLATLRDRYAETIRATRMKVE